MITHTRKNHSKYLNHLKGHKDASVQKALNEALKDRRITSAEFTRILQAALDGNKVNDQEFYDINRIIRKYAFSNDVFRNQAYEFLLKHYPVSGPFIYKNAEKLEGNQKVSTKSCATLVQYYSKVGPAWTWRQGMRVRGNQNIKIGTAVATFEDGFYPNKNYGNHAAYYLKQNDNGIVVMDQWADDSSKPTISSRTMRFKGRSSDGTYLDPSNNGDALFVIMGQK